MIKFAIRKYAEQGKHTPHAKPEVLKEKYQTREKALDFVRLRNQMQRIVSSGVIYKLEEL